MSCGLSADKIADTAKSAEILRNKAIERVAVYGNKSSFFGAISGAKQFIRIVSGNGAKVCRDSLRDVLRIVWRISASQSIFPSFCRDENEPGFFVEKIFSSNPGQFRQSGEHPNRQVFRPVKQV